MRLTNSLQNRYILKLFATMVSAGLRMIILFIVPKSIGPEQFGIYNYLTTMFSKYYGVLDAGTSTAFYVKLSQKNDDKKLITFYHFVAIVIFFFTSIVFSLLNYFDAIHLVMPDIEVKYIIDGIILSFLLWLATVQIKTMDAYSFTLVSELIKIIYSIFSFILFMIVAYFCNITLDIFFYYLIFSALLYNSLLFYKSYKIILWTYIIKLNDIKYYIKDFYIYTHPLFFNMIITTFVTMFDFWLLQKYGGLSEQGYYGLVFQIAAMSSILTTSMTPLISREFSKDFKNKKINRMRLVFKKYIPQFYVLASIIAVFVSYNAEFFISVIAGEKFQSSVLLLTIMAFYPLHQTYGQLSGAVFFATDKTKQYRNTSVFFMLVGIPLSYILLVYFSYGALGLVIKVLVIQFLSVNYQLFLNSKYLKLNYIKLLLHQFYVPIVLWFILNLCSNILDVENSYFQLILNFLFYSSVIVSLYFIWRKNDFIQKIQYI